MRSPRSRLVLASIVALVAVACESPRHSNPRRDPVSATTERAESTPAPSAAPSETPSPRIGPPGVANPVYRRAIERAARYLEGARPDDRPDSGVFAQMLARRFPDELGFVPRPLPAPSTIEGHELVLSRFVDPDHPPDIERMAAETNPVNRVVGIALWCDRNGFPDEFLQWLREMNEFGGAFINFGTLATHFAFENGCLTPESIPVDILDNQREGLTIIASNDEARAREIGIEAMALLAYIGHPERVRTEWLDELARRQNRDGGFSGEGPGSRSNAMTTVLALWCLLEHEFPGRDAPIIPPNASR